MLKRALNILWTIYHTYYGRPTKAVFHAHESLNNTVKDRRKDIFPFVVCYDGRFYQKTYRTYYRDYDEAYISLLSLLAEGKCAWIKKRG